MKRIDHVQVAIPAGGEAAARAFYLDLLGFEEIPKPPALQARGGAWLRLGDIELHLGVDQAFTPARKAHPGFRWQEADALAVLLESAGYPVEWEVALAGRTRFHTFDPFGNRLEFIDEGTRDSQD